MFSCSVSPSWRSLFSAVASVPTFLQPQRPGVPLPREQRGARLRESPPRRLRSPCLVASQGMPLPSTPPGSWETRAGGNGTGWHTGPPPGKRPQDCSVCFCILPIFFLTQKKKMSAAFNVLKAFSALKETSTRRGGRAGPRHLLTAFNQVPLSKQKQKPQQCKLSNDSMPALPLKHSARFCCALQQVERLHGTGFLHYPHHHPRSLIP